MPTARRNDEIKVHGQHACRALFARRPDDILRVYVDEEQAKRFGELLSRCAQNRRPYRVVAPAELEKLTESKHHEGICIVARPRPARRLAEVLAEPGPSAIVALADVGNPHNVGAILRTAAHFGARAVLLAGDAARLAPAAHRTAEGGAEWLDVLFGDRLEEALAACADAGFVVCATSSHTSRDLYAEPLPPRVVLLFGSEAEGLPEALLRRAALALRIGGTGHVESLNVSSAASVILGEWWRQHGRAPARAGADAPPARPGDRAATRPRGTPAPPRPGAHRPSGDRAPNRPAADTPPARPSGNRPPRRPGGGRARR